MNISLTKTFLAQIFSLLFVLLATQSTVSARWATYEDADLSIESYKQDIVVNENGSYQEIVSVRKKILKESAREKAVTYRLYYNGESSDLEILEAKTINGTKEINVPKNMIEDQALASIGYGFDDTRQILISFSNAEIGSEIYIKFKRNMRTVPLDKFWAMLFDLGYDSSYWKSSEVNIHSKIPLYLKENDPNDALKITQNSKDGFHNINIIQTKPIITAVTNEPTNGIYSPKYLTWVSVSSMEDWSKLGSEFSKDYLAILNQKLPKLFEEIAKKAKDQKNTTDVINSVTSQLADKIQYMGDWRSIKGKMIPRNLDLIASTQIGDCKDFSIATAAILKNLGYIAEPTLVARGERSLQFDALPDLDNFNHAIVKVTDKDNNTYWIDPTNIASMANGIFSDISRKKVLVLNGKNSSYDQIPDIDYNHAELIINEDIYIQNGNSVYVVGTATCKNEEAQPITGLGLYYSDQQIQDMIFRNTSGADLEENCKKKATISNVNTRIVEDITTSYEYCRDNALFKTNLGFGMDLPYYAIGRILSYKPDQVLDLFIGPVLTYKYHAEFKTAKIKQVQDLNYEIKTPWIYIKREASESKNGIIFDQKVVILKSIITNSEINSKEYKDFKKEIERNIQGSKIIFET
ncbi:MAG: DUF3857 domain-containing protein [Rickettsiaceae bacterium]